MNLIYQRHIYLASQNRVVIGAAWVGGTTIRAKEDKSCIEEINQTNCSIFARGPLQIG